MPPPLSTPPGHTADALHVARADWARAWAALPAEEILSAAEAIARTHEVQDIGLPQAGLGLLTLRDGAFHEPFYLGEVPVARAAVQVRTREGRTGHGGAVRIDDRARLTRAFAILDATLSARLPGWEALAALTERGMRAYAQHDAQRRHILARTRVDFSLLAQTGEDDDA